MANEYASQGEILELLSLLRPWQMANLAKARFGSPYDGGYVLPESARHTDLLISIGIGNEISFDAELANGGARIYQFDHTIQQPPFGHPNMTYFRKGWGPRTEGDLLSFDDILATADWSQAKHPVLKFDVEGAEWEGFRALDVRQLQRFEIMVGEFHDLQEMFHRQRYEQMREVFEKLCENHLPVHFHVNNYQSLTMVQGVPIPRVIEVSYLRRDCGVFAGHSTEPIPGPLDRPNNPTIPDICLRPI